MLVKERFIKNNNNNNSQPNIEKESNNIFAINFK